MQDSPLIDVGPDGRSHASPARGASYASAELLLQALERVAPQAHGALLDVGCGTKPYRPLFAPHVTRHLGLDWPNTPHARGNIDAFADARALPVRTASVDTVLCTEVLEHCAEPTRLVAEAFRVLRPGGTLILTCPFLYPVHEAPHDYFRFTRFGLQALLVGAGFEVVSLEPVGGFGAVCVNFAAKAVQTGALLAGRRAGREEDAVALVQGPLVAFQRAYLGLASLAAALPGLGPVAAHGARLYSNGHLAVARRA